MEAALLALAGWLDAVGLVAWTRLSPWIYPWANVLHVLGVVMLVGGIGIVDLRIVGLWRSLPLGDLARALTPVAVIGLTLQFASGLVLFAADGPALAGSFVFKTKLVLIALALGNAFAFRFTARGGRDRSPSGLARVSAAVSLALWLVITTLGRLIAYY